ncbi:hypothetical protein MOD31_09630, partial [Paenarthrobacter sp. TYUT067]|uniref:hypothetical protein n=1 Tax=Paenarthrobacter sp. TYUT067 TaxID=2926245 RepID=UPI00202EE7F4
NQKNNRYQQTWHTIEFSNNRSLSQSSTTSLNWIAPEQLFKLTRTSRTKQTTTRASHTNQKHTKAQPEPVI